MVSNVLVWLALALPLEHAYGTPRILAVWLISALGSAFFSAAFEDSCTLVGSTQRAHKAFYFNELPDGIMSLVLLQPGVLKSAAPMQNMFPERAVTAGYLPIKECNTSAFYMEDPPDGITVLVLLLQDTPVKAPPLCG